MHFHVIVINGLIIANDMLLVLTLMILIVISLRILEKEVALIGIVVENKQITIFWLNLSNSS